MTFKMIKSLAAIEKIYGEKVQVLLDDASLETLEF